VVRNDPSTVPTIRAREIEPITGLPDLSATESGIVVHYRGASAHGHSAVTPGGAEHRAWCKGPDQQDLDLTDHMQDAVNSLRIVLAADESVRTGQVVSL
jgi:hypothetical protein